MRSRGYGRDGDLALVCGFLSEAVAASPPHYYYHPGDFVWALFQNEDFDPRENVRLFEDDDGLLGYALLEGSDGVIMQTRPDLRGSGEIEDGMLSWATSRRNPETGIKTGSLETDTAMNALLEKLGFERNPNPSFKMLLHPLEDVPRVATPDGWSVRNVGDEEEWERCVDLHREVWSPSRVTLTAYERLRKAPGYDPSLDLVAVGPEGEFSAYAICWFDPRSCVGLFEPVGTHPEYRRMGLGKAVITEGLRRLRNLGARHALVLCAHDNEPALRLYENAGFRLVEREYVYVRS